MTMEQRSTECAGTTPTIRQHDVETYATCTVPDANPAGHCLLRASRSRAGGGRRPLRRLLGGPVQVSGWLSLHRPLGAEGFRRQLAGCERTAFVERRLRGKKIPLTVQSSKLAHLALTVWGETVGPGCPNLSIFVKPVGSKTLEGSYDVGVHGTERPEVHACHAKPARADPSADSKTAWPTDAALADPRQAIR